MADSEDSFPNNAGMSSWVGPFVSLVIFVGIIAVVIIYLKKISSKSSPEEEWLTERPLEAPSFVDWK